MSTVLTFTSAAQQKICTLIADEHDPHLKLRISIVGGGCSGFKYDFDYTDEQAEDDQSFTCQDNERTAIVLVDPVSLQYLDGSTVDYESGLEERFVVRNPKAKGTCGCGSSFAA